MLCSPVIKCYAFIMDIVFEKLHSSQEVLPEEWAWLVWLRAVGLKRGSSIAERTSGGLWWRSYCHGTKEMFLFITLGICTHDGKAAARPSLGAECSSKRIRMSSQLQTTPEQVSRKNELKHSATTHSRPSQRQTPMPLRWELLFSGLPTGCSFRPKYLADLSLSRTTQTSKARICCQQQKC